MNQEIESCSGKLPAFCRWSKVHHRPGAPEMPSSQGQTVRKGRLGFVIPGGDRHRDLTASTQLQREDSDTREQGQQDGGGASHGLVRPLALGLQPQLGSTLFTRDLDRPAPDDPCQDWRWRGLQVG